MAECKVELTEAQIHSIIMLRKQELSLRKQIRLKRAAMNAILDAFAAQAGLSEGDLSLEEEAGEYYIVSSSPKAEDG